MSKDSSIDVNVKQNFEDSIALIQAKMDSGSQAPLLLPLLGALVHLRDNASANNLKANKTRRLLKRPRMATHVV